MLKDIDGVEKALQDIEAGKIGDTKAKVSETPLKEETGKKETDIRPVACWHVRNERRLRDNLGKGICDLYSQPHANLAYKRMGLHIGARVQFCAIEMENSRERGLIIATGIVDSDPQPFSNSSDSEFPTFVKIRDVQWLTDLKQCTCYNVNPRKGSHRSSGRGPCS